MLAQRRCRSRTPAGAASENTGAPVARQRATYSSRLALASASMTGPTSVASDRVSPMRSSRIAPSSIGSTRSAMSSCTHRTRSAEQRWPALSNADVSASATACSGNAELSTIIAFWPPVSAISTGSSRRSASVRLMSCATSVDPVNSTPAIRGSATSAAPTVSPRPGSSCNAAGGIPARWKMRTASAAISGVCSAGLASTGLPAASAALICPVKIANGKFQGAMHAIGPRGVVPSSSRRACAA